MNQPVTNPDRPIDPTRTPETERDYRKGGHRLLARASKEFPGAGDAVDALVFLCSNEKWVLKPTTTRQYRAQIFAVIDEKVENGELGAERAGEGLAVISELLTQRRGRPEPRTSGKKVTDPTKAEVGAVLAYVAQELRQRTQVDLFETALLLMVSFGPTLGLRPIEWTRASIDAEKLTIFNAKSSNGRCAGPVREFRRADLPPKLDQHAATLIEIMKALMQQIGSWRLLRGLLAERLARICDRLEIRRLSLYSLRHISLANAESVGFSDAERAALAGHRSTATARRHYAGKKHGWGPGSVVVRAIEPVLPASWPAAKICFERREPDWGLASRPSMRI
jgi:integrase